MNFLDTYEITGAGTSTPLQSTQPGQSLNEEVSQVMGQLGRFWGGFRKQSQTALETARKDLGGVVVQAQKELTRLTSDTPQSTSVGESATRENASASYNEEAASPPPEEDKTPSASTPAEQESPASLSQSIFARIQNSLPPNIVSTVQTHLPETLKNASQNIDFAQLRTNLSTEFQRVQGVTRAQAEEYVHKSEELLRDAMREAGEVLKDAVKVIPPEDAGSTSGLVWDGTDAWMLPSPSNGTVTSTKGKGKQADSDLSGRQSGEGQRSVATRAESLLKQLKYDPAIIRADPETDEGVKEMYTQWLQSEVESKEGGLADKGWTDKVAGALSEPGDGQALQATLDTLVPSEVTSDTFWKRYLFRVYQVEIEEEKRKALLQGSVENDEVFSWEDDDEDATASSPLPKGPKGSHWKNESVSSQQTLSTAKSGELAWEGSGPSSQAVTPATTSPRLSSEDSYDLVSSGNASTAGEVAPAGGKGDDNDADSDWE